MASQRLKRWLVWGLRVVVGTVLVLLLASRTDFAALALVPDGRMAAAVAITTGILLLNQAISAWRWRLLLGPDAPPVRYLWRLYAIGAFFSLFLPTAVGGDAVRAAAASRALSRPGSIVLSVVADRAVGVVALGVFAVVGTLLASDLVAPLLSRLDWRATPMRTIALLAVAAGLALVCGWWMARHPKVAMLLRDAREYLRELWQRPQRLVAALGVGFLVQGVYILAWWVVALGLRVDIPVPFYFVAVPVVSVATMLPVTLSGVGIREGAWVLLFAGLGLAPALAVAYGLLYFAAMLMAGLVGGIVFVVAGTLPPHQKEAAS